MEWIGYPNDQIIRKWGEIVSQIHEAIGNIQTLTGEQKQKLLNLVDRAENQWDSETGRALRNRSVPIANFDALSSLGWAAQELASEFNNNSNFENAVRLSNLAICLLVAPAKKSWIVVPAEKSATIHGEESQRILLQAFLAYLQSSLSIGDSVRAIVEGALRWITENPGGVKSDSSEFISTSLSKNLWTGLDKYVSNLESSEKDDLRSFFQSNLQYVLSSQSSQIGEASRIVNRWIEVCKSSFPELCSALSDEIENRLSAQKLRETLISENWKDAYEVLCSDKRSLNLRINDLLLQRFEPMKPEHYIDDDPKVQMFIGAAYAKIKVKNYRSAIQDFGEASHLRRGGGHVIRNWLAYCYLMLEPRELDKARAFLEPLKEGSSVPRDWNLAYVYYNSGLQDQALKLLQRRSVEGTSSSVTKLALAITIVKDTLRSEDIDFLLGNLRILPEKDVFAFAFLLAYEQNRGSDIHYYGQRLLSFVQKGPLSLPSISTKLQAKQIQEMKHEFLGRQLEEVGISCFVQHLRSVQSALLGPPPSNLLWLSPELYYFSLREIAACLREAIGDLYASINVNDFINAAEQYCYEFKILVDQEVYTGKEIHSCLESTLRAIPSDYAKAISNITSIIGRRYIKSEIKSELRHVLSLLHEGHDNDKTISNLNALIEAEYMRTETQNRLKSILEFLKENGYNDIISDIAAYTNKKDVRLPVGLLVGDLEPLLPLFTNSGRGKEHVSYLKEEAVDLSNFMGLNNVRSYEQLINNWELVDKYIEFLMSYGDCPSDILQQVKQLIQLIKEFEAESDLDKQKDIAVKASKQFADFDTLVLKLSESDNLRGILDIMRRPLRFATDDVLHKVQLTPNLHADLLNSFLTSGNVQTSAVAEIGVDVAPASSAQLSITSASDVFSITPSYLKIEDLESGVPRTIRFKLLRKKQTDLETFSLVGVTNVGHITVQMPKAVQKTIPIKKFSEAIGGLNEIPVSEVYVVGRRVPYEMHQNFQGREALMTEIHSSLSSGQYLDGLRATGKSSILEFIKGERPSGFLPVYISLDTRKPKSPGSFFHTIAEAVCKEAPDVFSEEHEWINQSNQRSCFENDWGSIFEDFIYRIQKKLQGKKLLLLIDEFQNILNLGTESASSTTSAAAEVASILRSHLDASSFAAIFTGSRFLRETAESLNSPTFWRSVVPVKIKFIDRLAVERVLQKPASRYNVSYSADSIDRVWEYTSGYPCMVQVFGREILNILNAEERLVVCSDDVDEAAESITDNDTYFKEIWWVQHRLDNNVDGPIFELLLKESPNGMPLSQIRELVTKQCTCTKEAVTSRITALLESELIREEDGKIYFRSMLLEKWLRKKKNRDDSLPFDLNKERFGFDPIKVMLVTKAAVLIDFDNFPQSVQNLREKASELVVKIREKIGEVTEDYAVACALPHRWGATSRNSWEAVGISPRVPDEHFIHKPEAVDRQLEHLALDWCGKVEIFVFGSSDGDFTVTIKSLLQMSKQVWIIWEHLSDKTAAAYRKLKEDYPETFYSIKLDSFLSGR